MMRSGRLRNEIEGSGGTVDAPIVEVGMENSIKRRRVVKVYDSDVRNRYVR